MKKRAVSFTLSSLLLLSVLMFAFHTRSARAIGTIYIRADGSVDPPTAPISTVDEVTYVLTDNIYVVESYEGIVVERSHIIIDGNQHTLQEVGGPAGLYGLSLSDLSNVAVRNINIMGFADGIYLNSCSFAAMSANYVDSFSCDIRLESSSDNRIYGNILEGQTSRDTVKIEVSLSSNNNEIYQNKVAGEGLTISVDGSNNRIWGNEARERAESVVDIYGSNNTAFGNELAFLDVNGFNNTIDGNNIGNVESIQGANHTLSRNRIEGWYANPVPLEGFNHTVTGNDLEKGLTLGAAFGCNVSGNRMKSYYGASGVIVTSSSNNVISGNNITNSGIGIEINAGASNNYILHNNFIGNTQQVHVTATGTANIWDDGYPSGGNYWSDYDGYDLFTGPYQNESGSDGIGDVPYLISAENRDNYPFMAPFENAFELDIAIVDLLPLGTVVPRGTPLSVNATVKSKGFSQSPLTFNLTVKMDFIDATYSPVQRDFRLQASAAQGGNYTIPGPDITCFLGDTVALTMEGVDNVYHRFYVDYNGNAFPDSGEPQSPLFIKTTITYEFTADAVGNFTYYCAYNQNTMFGNFSVKPWPPLPVISARQSVTLLHKEEKNVTFTWDTTGWFIGDYTISSFADPVLGEVDIADNTRVDGTVSVTGGPPFISAVSRTPFTPNYDEDVVVSATIIDDKEVEEALLSYTSNLVWHNVTMNKLGDSFSAAIPPQPFDALVQYKIYANDTDGNWATSQPYSYTVDDFVAPEVRFSQIPGYPLPGQKVKVHANVTEPTSASGIKDPVFFSYRVNSGPWWNTTMVFNSGLGLYEITIPAYEKHDLVEYLVKAADNVGNVNTTALQHYEVLRCDVNHDGVVDVYDIYLIAKAWTCETGQPGYIPGADINEDGIINTQDLHLVKAQYGEDP